MFYLLLYHILISPSNYLYTLLLYNVVYLHNLFTMLRFNPVSQHNNFLSNMPTCQRSYAHSLHLHKQSSILNLLFGDPSLQVPAAVTDIWIHKAKLCKVETVVVNRKLLSSSLQQTGYCIQPAM